MPFSHFSFPFSCSPILPPRRPISPDWRSLEDDLKELVATPAVSGYESQLAEKIRAKIASLHPTVDNLGNVIVTMGTGSPHRLIVTPIDEPGFVTSGITDDGYLRVQRLPQNGLPPIFNELYGAQPVKVETTTGKWIDGVVAGLSVHLQPGRQNPPRLTDLENIYVDIGASSAAEARKAGVDNLSPIALNRRLFDLAGQKLAGASIGDRFGAAALLEVLTTCDSSKIKGTLTVAFVVQQWTGARGLQRILTTNQFDEMLYVGRLLPGGPIPGAENVHRAPRREPGGGVLIGLAQTDGQLEGLASDLKQVADANKIPIATDYSSGIVPPTYLALPSFPAKWAHIGIATAWPDTPAELIDSNDLSHLTALLDYFAEGSPSGGSGASSTRDYGSLGMHERLPLTQVLRELVEVYSVSNHEGPMRGAVTRLLPPWAKPETDDAGNLILRVGTAPVSAHTPSILIVAHMDEIGYEVKSISKDGRLEVTSDGGGELSFFLGHPALVHTATGDHDAIMELPNGWDEQKFEWPRGRDAAAAIRVDVGARTPEEVDKLGIKVGDTITIPKAYRPLLGTRANGRSFDDRVGDTALNLRRVGARRPAQGPQRHLRFLHRRRNRPRRRRRHRKTPRRRKSSRLRFRGRHFRQLRFAARIETLRQTRPSAKASSSAPSTTRISSVPTSSKKSSSSRAPTKFPCSTASLAAATTAPRSSVTAPSTSRSAGPFAIRTRPPK